MYRVDKNSFIEVRICKVLCLATKGSFLVYQLRHGWASHEAATVNEAAAVNEAVAVDEAAAGGCFWLAHLSLIMTRELQIHATSLTFSMYAPSVNNLSSN